MVKTKELTCIGCPLGCRLTAEFDESSNTVLSVSGQGCAIGKKYAEEELTAPTRMVTSLMRVQDSRTPLSVKTSKPIAKDKIFDCLTEIAKISAFLPIHIGEVMISGVCGTDVDIVATKELY